ncbi:MAG: toxin-antitoxin system YwqK family antitoxin [Cytophagales bacterium]
MLRYLFFYIFLLCLFAACSENKNENIRTFSANNSKPIASFVPEYIAAVPQINLSFKEYYKHKFEDYIVCGSVDSANLKQGYWKIQNVKDNVTYQGLYANDLQVGWWEVLSGTTLICAGNYEQNRKQGYWGYLQLGQKKTSKFVNYKNDMLSGLAREYTSDSILISSGDYRNGLKNGYWKFYSNAGVLKEQGDYYDDYKSGWWKSYDENGQILHEASYSRNEIAGYVIKYVNGIKSEEGKQYNEKKRGVWKYYDTNGNPQRIEEFDDYQ